VPVGRDDKIEYPVGQDAEDVVRFLAKVALGYAVSRRGLASFAEIFIRSVVRGDTAGAMSYVGGCDPRSPLRAGLEGRRPHTIVEHVSGELLVSVYLQLFRGIGSAPPPVYQVVVGRLAREV
jgi:hypothetical protein